MVEKPPFVDLKESEAVKERRWQEIVRRVESIRDRLGQPVDGQIKHAVCALIANGFETSASCQGHVGRGLPWPWIEIESPLSARLQRDPRYSELRTKARAMIRGESRMSAADAQDYEKLTDALIAENEKEYLRLRSVLDKFYAQPSEGVALQARLRVRKGPWSQSRIQPEGVPLNIRPEAAQNLWSEEVKTKNHELYLREIDRFSRFLKKTFLNMNAAQM
jgi:hypothetical protein